MARAPRHPTSARSLLLAAALLAAPVLAGCATAPPLPAPIAPTSAAADALHRLGLILAALPDEAAPLPTPRPTNAAPGQHRLTHPWRRAESLLVLGEGAPAGPALHAFPTLQATDSTIRLRSTAPGPLHLHGQCDGPASPWDTEGSRPRAASFTLTLPPGPGDGGRLVLGPDTSRCELHITPARGHPWQLTLLRDSLAHPALAELDARLDICALPTAMDPLENAVLGEGWLSRSCLTPPGPMRLLVDEVEAFNAKVVALTGRPLSAGALARGDPEMPLDFSAAPELELVIVSYLQVRADFSGALLARMLAHHAGRGTPVRILVSANLQTGKDRAMLDRLSAAYPAVQLQEYRWRPLRGLRPADRLQRGHHAKLFATIGKNRGESRFIVGGRNWHDGFLFTEPRDLAAHPALHDYTSRLRNPLAYFAAYEDLELELAGDAAVRAMSSHFNTLWHRDAESSAIRPFAMGREAAGAPRRGALHFLSVPHADGRALEGWLVDLFDVAERRIDLISPYLNPTPPVADALDRAMRRGVRVTLLLPELTDTDPLAGLKTAFESRVLRQFGGRMQVWRVARPDRLLHAKAIVIDGRLSIVTSANLNARSLLHDTENGVAVLDPGFAARLMAQRAAWLAEAEPLQLVPASTPFERLIKRSERVRGWF